MNLTLVDKNKKLLEFSVVLKNVDKKTWLELLPKMSDKQLQTLYDVLVEEVKAWKKEGISIIPDLSTENLLMPPVVHGASLNALKERVAPASEQSNNNAFKKELDREVKTPELISPIKEVKKDEPEIKLEDLKIVQDAKPDDSAWQLSDKVLVPKSNANVQPQALKVPKIRNRIAKHGLKELQNIRTIEDLKKVEPAHLRQRPLAEQITFIKQVIAQLARESDLLPVSVISMFEQSPLFQTYLRAGAMLLDKNSGDKRIVLDEIMGELEMAGLDSLSQQEFESIADLKKDLEMMSGL